MRTSVTRALAVMVAAGAVVAVESTAASASDEQRGEYQQVVHVTGDGSSVRIDHPWLKAGSIQFKVGTTTDPKQGMSSSITLFKPRPGKTRDQVLHDFLDEFSRDPATAAKGTRELTCDATFHGLADVAATNPMMVTENLGPGTYYAIDLGSPPQGGLPKATELHVSGDRRGVEQDSDLHSQSAVAAVEPDRFVGPNTMPHQGTLTFTNRSKTLHFLNLTPIASGTTAQQVITALSNPDPNAPPPSFLIQGPSGGTDVLSPGGSLQLSYDLPKGTYAMLCFVADDQTGMPHAMMGMVKIVVLT